MSLLVPGKDQFPGHPFHMVEVSPWPLLTSFALLGLTVNSVSYFQMLPGSLWSSLLGLLSLIFAMAMWFRDVAAEGALGGYHTFAVQKSLYLGILMFICTEVFFFVSIFWAYFHSALAPVVELGTIWPPLGIEPLNAFEIPLLNTIILLSSGASLTWAHHALIQGSRSRCIAGFLVTLACACVFTSLQGLEYYEAPFTMSDGVYGSTFYFATGFHGAHVLVGTAFLLVSFLRLLSYQLTDHHHLGFESAALYWHFVDLVWLFLWVSVYWWGS